MKKIFSNLLNLVILRYFRIFFAFGSIEEKVDPTNNTQLFLLEIQPGSIIGDMRGGGGERIEGF